MKRILSLLCVGILAIVLLGGCKSNDKSLNEILKLESELSNTKEQVMNSNTQKDKLNNELDEAIEISVNKEKRFRGEVDHNDKIILISNFESNELYILNDQNIDDAFVLTIENNGDFENRLTSGIIYDDSKILYTNKNYETNKCEVYQLDIVTKENKLLNEFEENFEFLAYENGIIYIQKSIWLEGYGSHDFNIYSLNLNESTFRKVVEFNERVRLLDVKDDWVLCTSIEGITLYKINLISNEKELVYEFKDFEYIMRVVFKDNETILGQIADHSILGSKKKSILSIDENGKITVFDENIDHLLIGQFSKGYIYVDINDKLYLKKNE